MLCCVHHNQWSNTKRLKLGQWETLQVVPIYPESNTMHKLLRKSHSDHSEESEESEEGEKSEFWTSQPPRLFGKRTRVQAALYNVKEHPKK